VIRDPDWAAPGGNLTWLIIAAAAILGAAILGWTTGWSRRTARGADPNEKVLAPSA